MNARAQLPGVAIIAGHYCLAPELEELSHHATTEEASFRHGAAMCRQWQEQGVPAQLYLWVNDIGLNAEERARIKAEYRVPENYQEIAEAEGLASGSIQVLFEGAARNRASTLLRQLKKNNPERFRMHASDENGLMRCIDGVACEIQENKVAYVIDGPEGENLVVKEGPNPKCNLILATLFLQLAKGYECGHIINVFNSIYINRIRLGAHVYQELFAQQHPVQFEHYFCDDARIRRQDFSVAAAPTLAEAV